MKEFTLVLNENDLQVLQTAVMDLPFKLAAPLIQKLNEQLSKQQEQKPVE